MTHGQKVTLSQGEVARAKPVSGKRLTKLVLHPGITRWPQEHLQKGQSFCSENIKPRKDGKAGINRGELPPPPGPTDGLRWLAGHL